MNLTGSRITSFFAFVGMLMLISVPLTTSARAHDHSTGQPADQEVEHLDADPVGTDAQEIAKDSGITVEEARAVIERQPRLGLLSAALEERGPESFGGIYLDYAPEYRITLLSRPGHASTVARAVSELGFDDLEPHVGVVETRFTEDVLVGAMGEVRGMAGGQATTLDVNIQTGEVLATADTEADAEAIRNAVASSRSSVQARRVVVTVGRFTEQHSYGGLPLTTCTAGFSVRRTTDGDEGVTTAAHCQDPQSIQDHHGGTSLDYVTEKYGDNADVQWHKTPGLTDDNRVRVSNVGDTREITSRTDRGEMVIGSPVCHYGKSSGFGCGDIESKQHDPDGSGNMWNAVFIRVANDNTLDGDSGGPWLLGNSAYGVHRGLSSSGKPVFTAQSFFDTALSVVVKINP